MGWDRGESGVDCAHTRGRTYAQTTHYGHKCDTKMPIFLLS